MEIDYGPMEWQDLTKIKGPYGRHIEQLWDEVKKLKEEVRILKERRELDGTIEDGLD